MYPLPFMSYLGGSKSASVCPPDPGTITFTTQEAIAKSSGKKSIVVSRIHHSSSR